MFRFVDDLGENLSGTGPTADDGHLLTRQVTVVPPVGCMPRYAFEVLPAGRVAPFRPIQTSNTLAHEISEPVLGFAGLLVRDGHMPHHILVIPRAGPDESLKLRAFVKAVLKRKFGIVCFNLRPFCVEVSPVCASQPLTLSGST
jgi:hypothetical protein